MEKKVKKKIEKKLKGKRKERTPSLPPAFCEATCHLETSRVQVMAADTAGTLQSSLRLDESPADAQVISIFFIAKDNKSKRVTDPCFQLISPGSARVTQIPHHITQLSGS